MDKYEYNLKLEEIDKLVDQGDYEEAANLADTIEWRRVRNVRTLCLISEIYEAAGKLDKSKDMLVRAYRKSPVGRNVLYRLVEVTTALGQYDEALEYYTEYVQTAPHDNNRFILKYKIYRGRGSSTEDLIAILEEYLGQEYTERWAYELAVLYQEAGQIQKCMATCDDLVLWFHTGKYVKKALEIKKRYAVLTPKQQQIYEICQQEEAQSDYFDDAEEEATVVRSTEDADGEVIAENIMAETEKEIAGEITARKAEKEKDRQSETTQKSPESNLLSKMFRKGADMKRSSRNARKESPADEDKKPENTAAERTGGSLPEEEGLDDMPPVSSGSEKAEGSYAAASELSLNEYEEEEESSEYDDLQVELAKSVRKVISGVARKPELNEDDVPAAVEERLRDIQEIRERREPEPTPGKLSIDDILLSMGEKGKQAAAAARAQREAEAASAAQPTEAVGEADKEAVSAVQPTEAAGKAEAEAVSAEAAGEAEKEAASAAQPVETAGEVEAASAVQPAEAVSEAEMVTASAVQPVEAAMAESRPAEEMEPAEKASKVHEAPEPITDRNDVLKTEEESEKPVPVRTVTAAAAEELPREQLEALQYSSNPEKLLRNRNSLPTYSSENDFGKTRKISTKEELLEAARQELMTTKTIRIPAEEVAKAHAGHTGDLMEAPSSSDLQQDVSSDDENDTSLAGVSEDMAEAGQSQTAMPDYPEADPVQELKEASKEETPDEEEPEEYYDDPLTIEPHLRGLFQGFTEIEGLEDQIANAILQAMAKGADRTSRNGNILIFGAHGAGKTTLATALAKAIAQEKGKQTAKMAKIYAVDLNRRDIAATIAKIAGGTLIIEEAGDLADNTVEQLTTAMEFRTDGLIVILEDEQRYIHNLLMKHPRFTMKFTAQIYLPVYTADELAMFALRHAREQDYSISEDGFEAIRQKVAEKASTETPMSVGDIVELVDRAIRNSNKFMRKMSMGKKRYDENDYVLLFAKDFK
ncbi:MAG: hypothetical protein LUD12_11245 [Lachnospiraceae bacterium]|nr:hypothetical protein [Lachnospiraceae bacterium]